MNLSTHCQNCFEKKENCSCNFDLKQIKDYTNLLPPFTILNHGRYYVGRVLGHGGFGVVYAGYDTSLESSIAIKEFFPIKNQLATRNQNGFTVDSNPKRREEFTYWHKQFLKEAKLLYKLNHPSIIRLHTILENENATTYLIMERLHGATLTEYLGGLYQTDNRILFNKRLSENEVRTLFIAAIKALENLHGNNEKQIIHLDINPNNIFLVNAKLDQLKLLDFGLARDNTKFQNNANDVIVGDPAFMAPEQIKLDINTPITTAADCYSLGACMYAALTGQIPITIARLTGTPLADLTSQLANVQDKSLIETIMACLNLDATQRPQHAMELNECLENTIAIESGHTILLKLPFEPINLESSNQLQIQPKHRIIKSAYKIIFFLIITIGILLIYCNLFYSTFQHRYKINNDDTVLDTSKGLLWKRCSEGQTWNGKTCLGHAIKMSWNEIMPNGQPKTWNKFSGQDNWQVPTIDELNTLIWCNDKNIFPNTPNTWFWSTSTTDTESKNAQVVYFITAGKYWTNRTNKGYVRLVKTDNAHSYDWSVLLSYCFNFLLVNK